MDNIWQIISKPDNVPIIGMLFMIVFFTWLALSQAFKNDRAVEEEK